MNARHYYYIIIIFFIIVYVIVIFIIIISINIGIVQIRVPLYNWTNIPV